MKLQYFNRIADQNVAKALRLIVDAINENEDQLNSIPAQTTPIPEPASPTLPPPLVASGLQGASLADGDFVLGAGGPYLKDSGFSVVPITAGGTGAITAAAARLALGAGDVNGPSGATDGHVALFDGASGLLIKDGGAPPGNVVGPASAVSGNIATFNGTTGKIIQDGGLAVSFGTYTPALSNDANLTASAASVCQYLRVGSLVTVSGKVSVTPTAAGPTYTQLGVALPIPSTFAANQQCGGTASSLSAAGPNQGALIGADTVNYRAVFAFGATDTGAEDMFFSFTYQII